MSPMMTELVLLKGEKGKQVSVSEKNTDGIIVALNQMEQ